MLREADVVGGHAAKIVDEVGRLGFVIPAGVFDFHAVLFQGGLGLFDLDLPAAVGEGKRQRAIDKNFHS